MRRWDSGCGMVVVVLLVGLGIGFTLGGICWPYTIEAWARYLGHPVDVKFWQGMLVGIVPYVGYATVPAAVITWALMLILGSGG